MIKKKIKILIALLLLSFLGYSQTIYQSQASEYLFNEIPSSIAEFIKRDIIISEENIVIKSYGTNATEIQTWRIQSKEENIGTYSSNEIYFAELASGEKYEYPAMFFLNFDKDGNPETITYEIPVEAFDRLPDEAPVKVRFILD